MPEHFSEVTAEFGNEAQWIVVDIPIGLFENVDQDGDDEIARECDRLARKVLGERHSSVFNPPAREVAEKIYEEDLSHAAASDQNRKITGKVLQQQAYHIADAIHQVDAVLRDEYDEGDVRDTSSVIEAHPEVCFEALADGDINHSKQTVQGLGERLRSMSDDDLDSWEIYSDICEQLIDDENHAIDPDDVVDALVLAYTGLATDNELQWLPHRESKDDQSTDACGLPMEIAYRAIEPFTVVVD